MDDREAMRVAFGSDLDLAGLQGDGIVAAADDDRSFFGGGGGDELTAVERDRAGVISAGQAQSRVLVHVEVATASVELELGERALGRLKRGTRVEVAARPDKGARGEIRGGRFVAGFSGEQFALPEAVASLRNVRRLDAGGEMVAIDASDPLNLIGTIVPGDRIPLSARERILLRDGIPIAKQSDREVRFIAELDSGEQWRARNALMQPLADTSVHTH